MAYSISFNSTDLSAYGLSVRGHGLPMEYFSQAMQLRDRSYSFDGVPPPRLITLGVTILGATQAVMLGYQDDIREVLNEISDKELKLDIYTDRYWNARFQSLNGFMIAKNTWQGDLIFELRDPWAYDNTEVDDTDNVDADPDTIAETTGGTAIILPVFTLTAGENLTAVTVLVENVTTSEELSWIGTLANTETLVINSTNWSVTAAGTVSMGTVTGKFPRLLPNQANSMKITGFSTTGTITMTYRNRYA